MQVHAAIPAPVAGPSRNPDQHGAGTPANQVPTPFPRSCHAHRYTPRNQDTGGRVALVPAACADLVNRGHEVWLEHDAGVNSGFDNAQYERVGVRIAADAAQLYEKGEMIVKVKEPIAGDLEHLRSDHLLFCYLHLAAEPELTRRLLDIGLTGIAFESVEFDDGSLPLLAPMSMIAGRIATQVGTRLLHQTAGGKALLGGLPATDRGTVVVFGAGAAGGNAAAWPPLPAPTWWCSTSARTAWRR